MTECPSEPPAATPTAVVLCPLAFEHSRILRALTRLLTQRRGSQSDWALPHVLLTGPGPVAIERAVEAFFAGLPPSAPRPAAILAGLAGELAPGASDVHVFAEATSEDGIVWRSPSRELGDAGLVILGLNAPACTPEEKAHWREESGAVFVDTESHAFARCCTRLQVPWVIVRGVSDRRHEGLPQESLNWVDAQGFTRLGRVLLDLARRPSLLPTMLRLGRRGTRVLPIVAGKIAEVIEKLPAIRRAAALMVPTTDAPLAPITPLPDELAHAEPAPPMVILFGGSFDPPHVAHVGLPVAARVELERTMGCEGHAWLVYVPAARSPLKRHGPIATDADRVAMLRLALAGVDRACVWTDEVDRAAAVAAGQPNASAYSYTIDTVKRFMTANAAQAAQRGVSAVVPTLRLLIGQDQAVQFHQWRDAGELLRLAEPLVMVRHAGERGASSGGDRGDSSVDVCVSALPPVSDFVAEMKHTGAWTDDELEEWETRVVIGSKAMDVSSSELRRLLSAPNTPNDVKPTVELGVKPEVLWYIRERKLYMGEGA